MNSNDCTPSKLTIVESSIPTQAIPIVSFPSPNCVAPQPDTPTTLSCPWEHLPPRCRNEPAVVACPTGQVRRMRSVLDMRLGPMAGPTNVTILPTPLSHPTSPEVPSPVSSFTRTSSSAADSHENLSPAFLSKLVIADEFMPYSPTSALQSGRFAASSNSDTPALEDLSADDASESNPALDVFGIPIPALSPTKSTHPDDRERPLSFESDATCSVLLAESPSSLDLSALLC